MTTIALVFAAAALAFGAALGGLFGLRGTCAGHCEGVGRPACDGCPRGADRPETDRPQEGPDAARS